MPPGKPLPNAADTAAAAGSLLNTGAPWSRKLEFSTGGSGRTAAGRVTAVTGGRAVVTAAAAAGGGRVEAAAAAADIGRLLVVAATGCGGGGFSGAEGRPGWALAGGGGRAANGDAAWGRDGRGGRPLLALAACDSSGGGPATAGGGGGSGCSANRSAEGRPPKIPLNGGRRKLSAGSLRKEPGCEGGRCCDAGGKTCPCRSSKNAGGDCSSSAFLDLVFLFFFFLSPSVSPLLWLKFSRTGLCCCCGRCAEAASGLRLLLLLGARKGSNDGCAAGQKEEEGRNPSKWETSAALRGGGPSKAADRSAKLRGGRAAAGLGGLLSGLWRSVGAAKRWGLAGTAGRAGPAAAKSPLLRGASPNLLESPSGSALARRAGGPKKPDSA